MTTKKTQTNEKLMAYQIDSDKNNLFDDFYKEDKFACIEGICQEMLRLNDKTMENNLKCGRLCLNFKLDQSLSGLEPILNEIKFVKRTQLIKYIEAYNYCNYKFQNNQPTDNCYKLGIEKVYLITRLESQEKREKLEQFVIDEKLTVKQLTELVAILNSNNDMFKLADKFNSSSFTEKE
jgi:hypothetical protein